MPGSYRRLRLISPSTLRDCRKLFQRDAAEQSMSRSVGCSLSSNFHSNTTKPASLSIDRWHQKRNITTGIPPVTTSSARTIDTRTISIGRAENVASFHSTPLSWFAAEAEEATAAAAGEEEPSPEDAQSNEQSATEVTYNIADPTPLSKASQDKVQAIFDKVLWLDMIEVHLLTQIVNEQMGISWRETEHRRIGGGVVAKKAGSGGAAEEEAVEEKTIFDLKLVGFDAKAKIKVIKEVRTIAGLGLKEAKELVEGAPKVIQKELKQEKAEELKTQLETVGAQVELV